MKRLKEEVKYFFKNDRGTQERFFIVSEIEGYYYIVDYYDSDNEYVRTSKVRVDGKFAQNAKSEETIRMENLKNFYTVWVEGSHKPVTQKFEKLKDAKEACKYLIDQKGCKQVYIMKKIGIAEVPSQAKFRMD